MRARSHRLTFCAIIILGSAIGIAAVAEDFNLAQSIQKDLIILGYDPGNADGEVTLKTVVAVSKFQAENNMEVTGELTPQLAGILSARTSATIKSGPPLTVTETSLTKGQEIAPVEPAAIVETPPAAETVPVADTAAVAVETPPTPELAQAAENVPVVEPDPAELEAAKKACIEQKIAAAKEKQRKRRGYGRLAGAITGAVSEFGSDGVANKADTAQTVGSTVSDLSGAARDLGLTDEDLAECENPT